MEMRTFAYEGEGGFLFESCTQLKIFLQLL